MDRFSMILDLSNSLNLNLYKNKSCKKLRNKSNKKKEKLS